MNRTRRTLALLIGGVGTVAALLGAPPAAADDGADCETEGGGDAGQFTACATPGNSQLRAIPNDLGAQGAEIDEGIGMFGGF